MRKPAAPKETITLRVPGSKKKLSNWKLVAIERGMTLGEFVAKAVDLAVVEQKNPCSDRDLSSRS